MNKLTTNLKTGLGRRMRFFRMIRGFFGTLLLTGLTGVLLFAVFINGCQKESPGIVNVCVTPIVIRTSPANGVTNVSINGATAVKVSISSTAVKKGTASFKKKSAAPSASVSTVKIITATFSTPMNANSLTTNTFTVQQGSTFLQGTVTYSDTTAIFIAPNGLSPNLIYTCTITTGAKDLAGTALATNYVWTFTTIAAGTPTLVAPLNGAVSQAVNPTLIWNAVPGADTYRLQVSLSNNFTSTIYNDSTRTNNSQLITGLTVGTTYYWHVNSKISGGTSAYSDVWSFTTIATPAAPVLVSPLDGAQNQPTSITLSWLASVGAAAYRLQVSASNTFAATVFDDSTITGTSQPIIGLTVGVTYYWRVDAKNISGTSAYSTRSFTTSITALQPPLLAAPADADTVITTSPTLSWNPSIGAGTYRLQVDTNISFTNPLFNDSTISGLSQPVSGLVNGKTYYWRVNAKNSSGTSGYSTTWRFIIATVPPLVLGSTSTFGIMATSAITSTGNSVINGDVSLNPGSSMSGFPPGVVNGAIHINDGVSTQARTDLLTAYNYFKNLAPGVTISAGADLGALYPSGIAPGTYTSGSTMLVSTPLVLDAGGNANAVWVFQIGSSLTTGANVTLLHGAQSKNVYWVPTLDATIGVGTVFTGTIVSGRDVTAVTGAIIDGRILAGATTAGTIALQDATVNVPAP
jgi:Ice-binding-like/Bacterial Ig-like domain